MAPPNTPTSRSPTDSLLRFFLGEGQEQIHDAADASAIADGGLVLYEGQVARASRHHDGFALGEPYAAKSDETFFFSAPVYCMSCHVSC